MFAVIVLALGALITATVMAFASRRSAAYWRGCALVLWLGMGALIVRASNDELAFLAPLGVLFLVVGVIGVLAKLISDAMDYIDRYNKRVSRRPTGRRRY